jgi:hypothetical protein
LPDRTKNARSLEKAADPVTPHNRKTDSKPESAARFSAKKMALRLVQGFSAKGPREADSGVAWC